jgi:hypothetical protein
MQNSFPCYIDNTISSKNNNHINKLPPNIKRWVNIYAAKILVTYYDMNTNKTYTKCFPITMKQELYNMGIL